MHVAITGDVVSIIAQWRRIERQQPNGGYAEIVNVIEPLHEAGEISNAISIGVVEGLHMQLIDDRVLVPIADGAIDAFLIRRRASRNR